MQLAAKTKAAAAGVFVLLLAALAIQGANFYVLDRAYERVTAVGAPTHRSQLEQGALAGLKPVLITGQTKMAPLLRDYVSRGDSYVSYRYFGSRHGIAVVYDQNGVVRRIWPEYE